MDKSGLTDVNPFYIRNMMKLSKDHDVVASEDIYSTRGMKLLAKGLNINDSVYEHLVNFKLRAPLETSMVVKDGVGAEALFEQAQALLDEVGPLSELLQTTNSTQKALSMIEETRLDQVGAMLVTMGKSLGTLPHCVMVSLFSLAIGIGLGLGDDMLRALLLAGLLHDAGEFYIDREFLAPGRKLKPEEWKHVAVHPHIGNIVLRCVARYPESIATAIGEHHERPNGFGYPRHLVDKQLSLPGKILMASESLSGIFTSEHWTFPQVCLAVKLIPGEYPGELVSLFSNVSDQMSARQKAAPPPLGEEGAPSPSTKESPCAGGEPENVVQAPPGAGKECMGAGDMDHMERIDKSICDMLETLEKMQESTMEDSTSAFLGWIHKRMLVLKAAMRDTIFSPCRQLYADTDGESERVALEIRTVVHEMEFQLREVSRELGMRGLFPNGFIQ
jgi:hypothetical protein